MERHKREQSEASEGEEFRHDDENNLWDSDDDDRSHHRSIRTDPDGRRSSEPPSSRPIVRRNRRSRDYPSGSDSPEEVEILPDRFDSHGQPLDGRSTSKSRWTTRKGTFHREPQRQGGLDVSGAWQVSGTDGEAVDRLVKNFTGALDGQKGWMGVLGEVLGSGLLPGTEGQGGRLEQGSGRQKHDDDEDDEDDRKRRRRRERR